MKRRVFVLPLSALVIAGLCAYKLSRSDEHSDSNRPTSIIRQAPAFELYDQRKPPQVVRLKSFLGRHEIVLVFFSENVGLSDPVLAWLRDNAEQIQSEGVKVIAISQALPQVHRKMLQDVLRANEVVPFQMLSDLDGAVHEQYGVAVNDKAALPRLFFIDRAGNLPWEREHALPAEEPVEELKRRFGE
jgi:peroxiredoxin